MIRLSCVGSVQLGRPCMCTIDVFTTIVWPTISSWEYTSNVYIFTSAVQNSKGWNVGTVPVLCLSPHQFEVPCPRIKCQFSLWAELTFYSDIISVRYRFCSPCRDLSRFSYFFSRTHVIKVYTHPIWMHTGLSL